MNKIKFIKLAALSGILLVFLDISIIFISSTLVPEFNFKSQYISELGDRALKSSSIINTWWAASSFFMLFFVWGLLKQLNKKTSYFFLVPLFLAVAGIGIGIIPAIFPCTYGCRGTTFSDLAHKTGSAIAIFLVIFLPTLFYKTIEKDDLWKGISRLLILHQIFLLFAFVIVALVEIQNFRLPGFQFSGLAEWILIIAYYTFILTLGINLFKVAGKSDATGN